MGEIVTIMPRDLAAASLALGLAATALGCAPAIDQRGNLPPATAIAEIKPGVTDRETVNRLLGSPSTVSTFDQNTWYYISQKTEEIAFFKSDLLDQEVVTIDFDKDGIVRDVQRTGFDARRVVAPVARTTPAPGKELSFIEQLIGNFGRFGATSSKGPGQ